MSVGECIICTCFEAVIRLIEMLRMCLWDNVSCAHICVGFIHLIEMLLVCLWENVSCARVFASVLDA